MIQRENFPKKKKFKIRVLEYQDFYLKFQKWENEKNSRRKWVFKFNPIFLLFVTKFPSAINIINL